MKRPKINQTLFLCLLFVLLAACAGPAAEAPVENAAEAPVVQAPAATSVPIEVGITHLTQPSDLPAESISQASDHDSSKTPLAATGGDFLTRGRIERPFNANSMDTYFPELDILLATLYMDEEWIYLDLTLAGNGAAANYALEFDTDRDGRGDFLIISQGAASAEWSVAGVQVWQDTDKSVGGITPVLSDKSKASHNGFESLLFDAGQGDDSDLAWSRLNPNGTAGVQLAVKKSLLTSDAFLWGSWAGRSAINPALFDLSDSYTIEEAGSALADSIFYPIKELSEVDNTCRQPVGFAARGNEYGLCPGGSAPSNEQDSCTRPPDCPEGNWFQSECACVYPG
jgi:hypothetical protein